MLHRNLGRVLHLFGGSAQHLSQACSSHRAGATHLALTTNLGARNRGALLVQHTHGGRSQEEVHDCLLTGGLAAMADTRGVVHRVVQYRRNNAGCTVRRGRHHTAAKGVLLVYSQSNQVHPVNRKLRRLAGILHHQVTVPRTRTATHLQRTGQIPHTSQRGADALLHDAIDMQDARAHLLLRA